MQGCPSSYRSVHHTGHHLKQAKLHRDVTLWFSPSYMHVTCFYLLLIGKKLWPESSLLFFGFIQKRSISLLTTFKVIDNSALGQRVKKNRQPYLIGFYRKRKTADPGDVIRVAVAGKTNKAIVIGTRKTKHHTVPRYDNNCIVLVDENLAPLGTRIKGPVPTILRRRQDKYSKVLALASRFIWCGLDSFSSMP